MSNVTVFTPGRIIGFDLPDHDGNTVNQAFEQGGSVVIRLHGQNATAELLGGVELPDQSNAHRAEQQPPSTA